MIARKVKIQVGAFVLIALLGVGYTGAYYAGLDRLFGARGYLVTAQFTESGGIFTNAEVTYLGVTVGRVGPLRMSPSGVDVSLDIDPDTPDIPADTEAVVTNRSAVGEQYVDLRPRGNGKPYLKDGSVIPARRTSVPVPPEDLLTNLDRTVNSVPIGSLQTVVDELDTAFTGLNGDLGQLLDASRDYTRTASQHLPQTMDLITNGRKVMETQVDQGQQIESFSRDMRLFAGQLRASDPQLRRVIKAAPEAAVQVSKLVRDTGPALGSLMSNLLTVANVYRTRLNGVEQTLVVYPMVATGAKTGAPGDSRAHFSLVPNTFDPYVCTKGYQDTPERTGTDLAPSAANTQAYCAEPPGSPIDVRGAQNAPGGR